MTYSRKPFVVEAIQVTQENVFEVAEWCGGEVKKSPPKSAPAGQTGEDLYVKVKVIKAQNDRQSQAFVGDWVLRSGNNFKVYTNKAFLATFDPLVVVDPDSRKIPGKTYTDITI